MANNRRTMDEIFASIDQSKAARAYEANMARKRKVEEAERQKEEKRREVSAVEKYRVYDDEADEMNDEPVVMIPKEQSTATKPDTKVSVEDIDEITASNPFVDDAATAAVKPADKQVAVSVTPPVTRVAPDVALPKQESQHVQEITEAADHELVEPAPFNPNGENDLTAETMLVTLDAMEPVEETDTEQAAEEMIENEVVEAKELSEMTGDGKITEAVNSDETIPAEIVETTEPVEETTEDTVPVAEPTAEQVKDNIACAEVVQEETAAQPENLVISTSADANEEAGLAMDVDSSLLETVSETESSGNAEPAAENAAVKPEKGKMQTVMTEEEKKDFTKYAVSSEPAGESFCDEAVMLEGKAPDAESRNEMLQEEENINEENIPEEDWMKGLDIPQIEATQMAQKVKSEEANVFVYTCYNSNASFGAYGLCIDMGGKVWQSAQCGYADNEVECVLRGALDMFRILRENGIRDVTIYTEPSFMRDMKENATRLRNGKSEVCRDYIKVARDATVEMSIHYVVTPVQSQYAQLAQATAKYLGSRTNRKGVQNDV